MITALIDRLPDDDAALQLLEMFDKLLRKYARLLGTEDAYEELRLFFFELLEKLKRKRLCSDSDGYAVSYISKSVKNQYIALSKARNSRREDTLSDMSEKQMAFVEQIAATDDSVDISSFFPSENKLSERERIILQQFFVNEYSIEEISQQLNISRQAVNQAKNRALNKIRRALE